MTSSVSMARANSESVKTTIPSSVADTLGLGVKDTIQWDVDKANGVWTATIRKA